MVSLQHAATVPRASRPPLTVLRLAALLFAAELAVHALLRAPGVAVPMWVESLVAAVVVAVAAAPWLARAAARRPQTTGSATASATATAAAWAPPALPRPDAASGVPIPVLPPPDAPDAPPPDTLRSAFADHPSMADLVTDFARALPGRVDRLRASFDGRRFDEVAREAHQLKGAGGSYGFAAITTAARAVEAAARIARVTPSPTDIRILRESIERLSAVCAAAYRGAAPAPAPGPAAEHAAAMETAR